MSHRPLLASASHLQLRCYDAAMYAGVATSHEKPGMDVAASGRPPLLALGSMEKDVDSKSSPVLARLQPPAVRSQLSPSRSSASAADSQSKMLKEKLKENVNEAKLLRRKVNAVEGEQKSIGPIEEPVLDSSGKLVSISNLKRTKPEEKKKIPPKAKRFKSPLVPMVVKSPGIRMLMSPSIGQIKSPSIEPEKSSPPTPISPRNHGSLHRNKRRKLRSEIWKDFEPIYDGSTLAEAQCVHCSQVFKVTREVGTSACLRHLSNCEGKVKMEQMIDEMKTTDASFKDWKFNQEVSRQELVKLIVVHELPFSLVEYPKFRSFVSSLNPWFTHISRTTIKSDCISTYEEGREKLRETLKNITSRVSLTADLWTSNQNLGYLCVTCHYIDLEWRIYKRIIKFALVETPHDGRNMFNAMLRTLQDWNLEHKVFSITLDNATVNDCFVNDLKENLVGKHLLLRKGKLLHRRCAAHVLNLIVQEGFKFLSGAVSNIRDSVKYIKSSQARKERFEKAVEAVGICCDKRPSLDIVTRWNSTYHMLQTASEYRRAFESLTREDSQYVCEPLPEEWNKSKKLCLILEKFYGATKAVSGSKYPIATLYFHQIWDVKLLLESESSNSDPTIASIVCHMKGKLMKYWNLSFLTICIPVIFDPRFKLGFIEFRLKQGFGDEAFMYFSKVQKTFQKLFDEYSLQLDNLIPKKAQSANEDYGGTNNSWANWGRHQNMQKMKTKSELDRYLGEETVSVDVDVDILQYWKVYSTKYPVLASMARDLLAVPASTVPSESAFSTGERVISDYRSRLTSHTVEALICLQDWIRGDDTTRDNISGNIFGDANDNI
ncbi:hypothetical protein ACP4OV_031563 [Aristida adscensionis]